LEWITGLKVLPLGLDQIPHLRVIDGGVSLEQGEIDYTIVTIRKSLLSLEQEIYDHKCPSRIPDLSLQLLGYI
uniref:hypothetical protein n=1 Tax=Acinetobacter baumannii TaxID=470 RepID=UPI001C07396A